MIEKLKPHLPQAVFDELPTIIERYQLTPLRLAHLLAQCDHESGGFKRVAENLNYSADGLQKTFGKYFKKSELAIYARNPQKIGNRVYAMRLGNGVEASGDGFYYRGRGYLQITGKKNIQAFFKSIRLNETINPDIIATTYPLTSAAWFFDDNRLWKWCDHGATEKAVIDVSKKVNGGDNGLDERIVLFNKYWQLLK